MNPARGLYPPTDALVEWLSANMQLIQESTFKVYRQAFSLVRVVQAVEEGKLPKYAATSAIRDYNSEFHTSFTYLEIRDLDSTFIFSDVNEDVVFTDRPFDIICGDFDNLEEALTYAPESVTFILLWSVETECLFVYRSPFIRGRKEEWATEDKAIAWGEEKGSRETYVLPPEVEASLHSMRRGELFR